jgi:low affinity Fe/Cu permease
VRHPTREWFRRFACATADAMGSPWTFFLAVLLVIGWAAAGPVFHFSAAWQLVINTATTIITFLMVFVIQNTQNRDTVAMQIKLDEMIRVTKGARNALLDLEELDESELEKVREDYERLAQKEKSVDKRLTPTKTVSGKPAARRRK